MKRAAIDLSERISIIMSLATELLRSNGIAQNASIDSYGYTVYSGVPNKSGGKTCRIKVVVGHIGLKQIIAVGAL